MGGSESEVFRPNVLSHRRLFPGRRGHFLPDLVMTDTHVDAGMADAEGGSSNTSPHRQELTHRTGKQTARRGLAGTTGGREAFVVMVTHRGLGWRMRSPHKRGGPSASCAVLRARLQRSNPRLAECSRFHGDSRSSRLVSRGGNRTSCTGCAGASARREVWRCGVRLLACACTAACWCDYSRLSSRRLSRIWTRLSSPNT